MKLQLRKYDFLWYSKGLDLFSGDPPLILYHQINHPFHHIDLVSTFLLSRLVYTLLYSKKSKTWIKLNIYVWTFLTLRTTLQSSCLYILESFPFLPKFVNVVPAHKFFPKLFLAGFIWLAIVDVVEGVDTCVIAEISKKFFNVWKSYIQRKYYHLRRNIHN